jgi:hypothetical protein
MKIAINGGALCGNFTLWQAGSGKALTDRPPESRFFQKKMALPAKVRYLMNVDN